MTAPARTPASRRPAVLWLIALLLLIAVCLAMCHPHDSPKKPEPALVVAPTTPLRTQAEPVPPVAATLPPPPAPAAPSLPLPLPPPAKPPESSGIGSPAPRPPPPAPAESAAAGNSLPAFLPAYPGAAAAGQVASMRANGTVRGEYEFATADTPETVGRFYQDRMTSAGLTVMANVAGRNPAGPTYTLLAEDAASGRSISLTAATDQGHTRVSIAFTAK